MELQHLFEEHVEQKLKNLLTADFFAKNRDEVLRTILSFSSGSAIQRMYDALERHNMKDELEFNYEVIAKWIQKTYTYKVKYWAGESSNGMDITMPGCQVHVGYRDGTYEIQFSPVSFNARTKKSKVTDVTKLRDAIKAMITHANAAIDKSM